MHWQSNHGFAELSCQHFQANCTGNKTAVLQNHHGSTFKETALSVKPWFCKSSWQHFQTNCRQSVSGFAVLSFQFFQANCTGSQTVVLQNNGSIFRQTALTVNMWFCSLILPALSDEFHLKSQTGFVVSSCKHFQMNSQAVKPAFAESSWQRLQETAMTESTRSFVISCQHFQANCTVSKLWFNRIIIPTLSNELNWHSNCGFIV